MNFDDRLKNELQNQGAQISIEPAGVDDIANRSAKRRQRRMAGMTAAVAVVLLGIGGFIATTGRGSTPVATDVSEEAQETKETQETEQADQVPESSEEPAEVIDGKPLAGSPLEFVNVASGASPGGFGVFGTGVVTADAYYMLSTAPGKPASDDNHAYRPDTLYRFDGSTWTNSSFDDRFISSLSSDGEVLYTVSTGTKTSDSPAIGSSTDGGQNWQWTPIDLTEQFGADPSSWPYFNLSADSANGSTFVVAHASPGPDWTEGIEFAKAAGLDIDEEIDGIIDLTIEGISWVPAAYELSPCASELESSVQANLSTEAAALEEEINSIYLSSSPSDEQLARAEEISRQLGALYEQARADAIDSLEASGTGCEAYAGCAEGEQAMNERWASIEEGGEEVMLDEAEYAVIEQEYQEWLDNSGCADVLGYQDDEFDADEIESATWAELGVDVPASWYGSTSAYLVSDGQSQTLGAVGDSEAGWLEAVEYDGNTFSVVFNGVWGPEHEDGNSTPDSTVYSSTDGTTWTTTTRPFGVPRTPINGMTIAIDWSEEESSIVRNGPNGSERLTLRDLAPNIDTTGFFADRVYIGDYGVVITASKWQEYEASNPLDSIVFYSPDGLSFGATALDGVSAHSVMVGADGVIVFSQDPSLANSGTPQPVWFGTAQ